MQDSLIFTYKKTLIYKKILIMLRLNRLAFTFETVAGRLAQVFEITFSPFNCCTFLFEDVAHQNSLWCGS